VDFFAVDTSAAGVVNGGIFGSTTSEGAEILFDTRSTTGHILRASNPSFSNVSDMDSVVVKENYDADSGVQMIDVPVHNFGYDSDQALLDLDSIDSSDTPFGFLGSLVTDIGAAPATLSFSFDTTALTPGTYMQSVDVDTSDEDIPGETASVLSLTLSVTIDGVDTCAADIAENDGLVNVFDLIALLSNWNTSGPGAAIAAPTDTVDVFDLLALLEAWGACDL
jgi:hypothetical protein